MLLNHRNKQYAPTNVKDGKMVAHKVWVKAIDMETTNILVSKDIITTKDEPSKVCVPAEYVWSPWHGFRGFIGGQGRKPTNGVKILGQDKNPNQVIEIFLDIHDMSFLPLYK